MTVAGEASSALANSRDGFSEALANLKRASSYSYQSLSNAIDRPTSTVHGWCAGYHLPYPRDNDVFEELLHILGVDDTAPWMQALSALRGPSGVAATANANPYRGLAPFTEDDSALFHGRSPVVDLARQRVRQRLADRVASPIMMVGPSGAGKTSILRAGLTPSLLRHDGITVDYFTPRDDLADQLAAVAANDDSDAAVVIVDQFEKLFVGDGRTTRGAVVEQIDRLAGLDGVAVIVGLRADFFRQASAIPTLLVGLQNEPLVIGRLNFAEATDCIVKPAERAGLTVAPDLVVELIAEFARHVAAPDSTEALPLLSHVLHQLTENSSDGQLTVEGYRALGGLGSSLQRTAETVHQSLDDHGQLISDYLFTLLVELDDDAQPTRRTAAINDVTDGWATLSGTDDDDAYDAVLDVIDRYAADRLLTTDVDTVTISHESLLTAWPRLQASLETEQETLAALRRIGSAAQQWADADFDPGALLRSGPLDTAARLVDSPARLRLSAHEIEFIAESIDADAERARHDREVLSRQLAMQAAMLRDVDPSLSAQVAVLAHRTEPTTTTRSALVSATAPLPGARYLGPTGHTVLAVGARQTIRSNAGAGSVTVVGHAADEPADARSPATVDRFDLRWGDAGATAFALAADADGALLAVGDDAGRVTLVDASTKPGEGDTARLAVLSDVDFGGAVHAVAMSPDGDRLVAGGVSTTIACWDIDGGSATELAATMAVDHPTTALALSGDGRLLVSGHADGTVTVRLLEPSTNPDDKVAFSAPGASTVGAVAMSSDATVMVAGYHDGSIRLWRIGDGVHHSPLTIDEVTLGSAPFATWVNSVDISADGTIAAAASSDGTVRLWNLLTAREIRPDLRHPTIVTSVRFGTGHSLLTGAEDGTVRTWDISAAHGSASAAGGSIWASGFSADGDRLLTTSRDGAVIHRPDGDGGLEANTIVIPSEGVVLSGSGAIAPDGTEVAIGTRTGQLLVASADRSAPDRADRVEVLDGLTGLVEFVAWAPDGFGERRGDVIGAADNDGNVGLWVRDANAATFRAGGSVTVDGPALGVALSAVASAMAVSSAAGTVALFDASDPDQPRLIDTVPGGAGGGPCVVFHPTAPVCAIGRGDGSVSVWDLDVAAGTVQQRCVLTGPGGHVMGLDFRADGALLAAAITDGRAWVWDTSDLDAITHLVTISSDSGGVYAVAFAPDGRTLVGAGAHQRLYLWSVDDELAIEQVLANVGDTITEAEWAAYVPSLAYDPSVLKRSSRPS